MSRPHPAPASEPAPDTSVCPFQEKCTKYSDFVEGVSHTLAPENRPEFMNPLRNPDVDSIYEYAARKAREDTIWELLTHFGFSCPGGELTPICDMCGANAYCIELRSTQQQAGEP